MTDPIKSALEVAAKRLCICDGECFETRHGMMHGPCEADLTDTAAAIAAYHDAMAAHFDVTFRFGAPDHAKLHRSQAAAVRRAAGGE